jgi:membrane protease YdiL (CAAX protease family)
MLLVGVGFPVLALAIAAWGRRAGVSPADWQYDWSLRPVLAGVVGVVIYFVVFVGVTVVYSALFGTPTTPGLSLSDSPALWVLTSLLLVNSVVVPFAEELAWRGVVQTALTREYGAAVGVVVTATAFVVKHLVVDAAAPPFRVASLAVIALVLGLLRHRYGTASSTVSHLGANGIATALSVLQYL